MPLLVHCCPIYARQKFFDNALTPDGAIALLRIFGGRKSSNNVLAVGIYSYNSFKLKHDSKLITPKFHFLFFALFKSNIILTFYIESLTPKCQIPSCTSFV